MEMADLHVDCRRESADLSTQVSRLSDQLRVLTQRAKAESPVKVSFDENESLKVCACVRVSPCVRACQFRVLTQRDVQTEIQSGKQ